MPLAHACPNQSISTWTVPNRQSKKMNNTRCQMHRDKHDAAVYYAHRVARLTTIAQNTSPVRPDISVALRCDKNTSFVRCVCVCAMCVFIFILSKFETLTALWPSRLWTVDCSLSLAPRKVHATRDRNWVFVVRFLSTTIPAFDRPAVLICDSSVFCTNLRPQLDASVRVWTSLLATCIAGEDKSTCKNSTRCVCVAYSSCLPKIPFWE